MDYRVTVKVRNNRILKAIEEVGGVVGGKWCEANGLSYQGVNHLINMTVSPITGEGRLTKLAERLCDVLNKTADDLWSSHQLYPLEKNFAEMEMSHEQVLTLMSPGDGDQVCLPDTSKLDQEEAGALINKMLGTLRPKARKIIQLRYFSGLTLVETAERLGVSRGRILQIEESALRQMRQPARLGIIVDAVDGVSAKDRAKFKQEEKKFFNH